MEQFDPNKVKVIIDGHIVVGFAEGSKITGERTEEKRTMYTGADGHTTFVKSANDTGTVTVNLKHNSPSNNKLRRLYKSDREFTFGCVDANFRGDMGIKGSRCVIQNTPSFESGPEVTENEWILLVADYEQSFADA